MVFISRSFGKAAILIFQLVTWTARLGITDKETLLGRALAGRSLPAVPWSTASAIAFAASGATRETTFKSR